MTLQEDSTLTKAHQTTLQPSQKKEMVLELLSTKTTNRVDLKKAQTKSLESRETPERNFSRKDLWSIFKSCKRLLKSNG